MLINNGFNLVIIQLELKSLQKVRYSKLNIACSILNESFCDAILIFVYYNSSQYEGQVYAHPFIPAGYLRVQIQISKVNEKI